MKYDPGAKCSAMSNFRLCSCVFDSYGSSPLETAITAHKTRLIPIGWRLNYSTLDEEPGRRFCTISFCTKCSSLYCEGDGLPDGLEGGKLLSFLYGLLYRMAERRGTPTQNDSREWFGAEFLRLFHEVDKPAVSDWLNLLPNKVIQKYFSSENR